MKGIEMLGRIFRQGSVAFSKHAQISILSETYSNRRTETGGILLGHELDGRWYVVESIDPGLKVRREAAYFEYDQEYVNHLFKTRSRLYAKGLELLGLWHRHPGSFNSFSGTDMETHKAFLEKAPERGILSCLVNLAPEFRLTAYNVTKNLQCRLIRNVRHGDGEIPKEMLEFKAPEDIEDRNLPIVERILDETDRELEALSGIEGCRTEIRASGGRILISMKPEGDLKGDAQVKGLADRFDAEFFVKKNRVFCLCRGKEQAYRFGCVEKMMKGEKHGSGKKK